MKSILSQRGYSVAKATTDEALLEHHRQRLTITPHVERQEYAHLAKPIKIYQETDKRVYFPRFYGTNEIGPPDMDKLSSREFCVAEGLKFNGTMRGNQKPVVDVTLKSLEQRGGAVVSIACGQGKCWAFDTPILLFDGKIKKVQDVAVGDLLMGDDSTPRRVLSLGRGREMMYDIVPTKGDTYTVNESHILSLKCSTDGKYGKKGDIVDMALKDYLALPASYHGSELLGYRVGVEWPEVEVPIDPYLLGAWVGDEKNGEEPYIPHFYKCNSRKVRMAVLAGLIDTDGSLKDNNSYDIIQKRKQLAEDITFLARSLGFAAYMKKECQKTTYYRVNIYGEGLEKLPLLLEQKKASPHGLQIKDPLVTRIKVVKKEVGDYYGFTLDGNHRFLMGDFTVGHNTVIGLYLGCQLNNKKPPPMGVVCHTTAMMKQWQERIEQFVPKAKIGLVQRDKCIIEGKDIVIMSVKTVAKRKYSKHAFDRIGFIVWDEIHLMCTDLFSKAFPKLATKYTLGLSATPYRKDQLDSIFQYYIGPVVYLRKREKNNTIEARCITLLMNDIDVKLNRYNKIMYTPTTTACVNREERTEWLAQHAIAPLASEGRTILVLGEYVKQLKTLKKALDAVGILRPANKNEALAVMMGCHSRLGADSPLRMLSRHVCRKIVEMVRCNVTVGLYIGEMKNDQRKESEEMDIILGTYKLASVGMDIPRLNTLVFASPRKEIEQSVGRILRKSHAAHPPLIVDVIDNHSLFKAQSATRKKFYRTYGYTIVHQRVELDGTVVSTRRTKPQVEAIDIGTPPPSSDETDSGGENSGEFTGCMFED